MSPWSDEVPESRWQKLTLGHMNKDEVSITNRQNDQIFDV